MTRPQWFFAASLRQGIASVRLAGHLVQLKAPWNRPLFSERIGCSRIMVSAGGWRLLRKRPGR